MNPFFFGTSERRIFGVYEPAAPHTMGKRAAVLCYPWGCEYLHAHRTMRQLASKLSAAGFHTLRFDYFGTGDSGGEMVDVDLAGWETDVETAMEEIRDISGSHRTTLVGLRLGATIAASVAAKNSRTVESLILWDPVVSGDEYLQQLGTGDGTSKHMRHSAEADHQTYEISGFPLTQKQVADLRSIDLGALIMSPPARTLMMLTERLPSHERLFPMPANAGVGSLEIEAVTAIRPWIENSTHAGGMPIGVIQRIVGWLE